MTNLVQADPDAILAIPLGGQCIAFMHELGNAQAANPDFDPSLYDRDVLGLDLLQGWQRTVAPTASSPR